MNGIAVLKVTQIDLYVNEISSTLYCSIAWSDLFIGLHNVLKTALSTVLYV